MRLLLIAALVLSQPVLAQKLDFKVLRGECAGDPSDLRQPQEVQSTWHADGTLELTAWDDESQQLSVVDGSGILDTSTPGTLRLVYLTRFTPIPPDAPIPMCEQSVSLKFFIRGIERADYLITIEKSRLLLRSGIKG